MRLFQNSGIYAAYLPRLRSLTAGTTSFSQYTRAFLADRFGAPHFLQPVLDEHPDAFFTNGDDPHAQQLWARERGLPTSSKPDAILLAQIEEHRTEVFYNLDPLRFGSAFVRRLPGSVRRSIAWRAAPSPGADFGAYNAVVCNFPSILASYAKLGWKTAWFAPAHDPAMDRYATNGDRPVDITFIGGFSRHHQRRARLLEAVAQLGGEWNVAMHLDRSRANRLAESAIGKLLPLSRYRRPAAIRRVSHEPIFGTDLYARLSQAKIVVNGAIDMAGSDRGNMRCFEALGCGCLLLTDAGLYPEGMTDGQTIVTYSCPDDAMAKLRALLADADRRVAIARQGYHMTTTVNSKNQQWSRFTALVQ